MILEINWPDLKHYKFGLALQSKSQLSFADQYSNAILDSLESIRISGVSLNTANLRASSVVSSRKKLTDLLKSIRDFRSGIDSNVTLTVSNHNNSKTNAHVTCGMWRCGISINHSKKIIYLLLINKIDTVSGLTITDYSKL